jgi:signal peptidase I
MNLNRLFSLSLFAVIVALLLRHFVVDVAQVTSASMQPTITTGHRYFYEKMTYHFRKPQKKDIVAFPSPVKKGRTLLKRIIATAGDTLAIRNKNVYINKEKLVEEYVFHSRNAEILAGDQVEPLVVPEGMVFVMGDNRDVSEDSRDWKDSTTGDHIYFIPTSTIIGKLLQLK